eukprot:TRINITY_DN11335_c0_g1_i1.p1 TRINITY_DN11335_c0_g1~~TRINITY_DN11335_c0_g1_i1.p1  ORF type:complete len:320 (-),score=67.98 TRINITY_DN11335_c0_g1_i1:40-918(-)
MYDRNDFKWIVLGGSILALHSGYINTIGIRSVFGYTVTHVTGLITKVADSVVEQQWVILWNSFIILAGFALGAFFTGILCGSNKFKLQPRYGVIIMLESITLYFFVISCSALQYPQDKARYAFILLAMAVGMQNAMFSSFSGAVVRTSHLTGLINDTFMLIGQYVRYKCIVRKKSAETWKLLVFFPLLSGFMFGCLIGDYAWRKMGYKAILLPATSTGIAGLTFFIWITMKEKEQKANVDTTKDKLSPPPQQIEIQSGNPKKYVDLEEFPDTETETENEFETEDELELKGYR